jgi:hypothetical protein
LILATPLAAWADDAAPTAAKAEEKPAYVRITRDPAEKPVALETAVVTFRDGKPNGVCVDLVAAVHVGEKAYYADLGKRFKAYDAVLYELVAAEGTRPKAGEKGSSSPVSMLQKGLKQMLNLEFQLEAVDYTAKNFVHADMSPDEFSKAMKDRGESFWTMFWRMMGHAMAQQSKLQGKMPSDFEILMALFDKNRSVVLKRLMAEQMGDLEGSVAAIEGPNGSTLVSGRNQKALEVLRKELAAGKKKLAIFYGAAHMPDFETRLAADFGLKPEKTQWLQAWDLTDPKKPEKKANDKK